MKEIEKKFLISDGTNLYFPGVLRAIYPNFVELTSDVTKNGIHIWQGYLPIGQGLAIAEILNLKFDFRPEEARLRDKAKTYFFTLKGDGTVERDELELPIVKSLFDSYWPETQEKRVNKIRLKKPLNKYVLEIDFYLDRKLVVIEVETKTLEEAESLPILGKDITQDKSFKNKNLAK